MLDTARRYYSVDFILSLLDAMAVAKFNVFHWHIVDDESFPLELKSFPNLTFNAAYKEDEVYTQAMVRQIVTHAKKLAIRVVPEFDNPGHTRAIGLDPYFNEIIRCFNDFDNYEMPLMPEGFTINGHPKTSALDPSNPKTYELLQGILTDLNSLFPDNMVHLGGDEVDTTCYDENPYIQTFMAKHNITSYDELVVLHMTKVREQLTAIN